MNSLKKYFQQIVTLLVIALLCVSCVKTPAMEDSVWQAIQLPTKANLQDLAFTSNPQHGWVVGSEATLLETKSIASIRLALKAMKAGLWVNQHYSCTPPMGAKLGRIYR
jgi:photosystem II stability/assembly factor-like uncharacterized protein